ncbi:MAG TPA: ParB N-terminal domain-containing protein, partial [Spirochaetales bacterium]|nr:ParB N-terminal domain-containing protein [Spirochaetales bacterium]
VSGHRRLEAAKSLGWTTIEAIMIRGQGKAALLELELDENLQRAQLSADEVADGLARLERLNHPGLLARLWNALVAWFKKLFHIED